MELFNEICDWLFYGIIEPLFLGLSRVLSGLLLVPMEMVHLPVWLQVSLVAMFTALFSLALRTLLRVDEKVHRFNEIFTEKRRRQQDLQLIPDKYSRDALYRVTDEELNEMYNTYLAYHYARYVTIYLLPIFLVLAWLNNHFSEAVLRQRLGSAMVIRLPENGFGVQGLSVTFIFLVVYILCLIAGFRYRRRRAGRLGRDR